MKSYGGYPGAGAPADGGCRICLVLPTLEEESGIRKVMGAVHDPRVKFIIVVDGYSGDNTVITARSLSNGRFQTGVMFQQGRGKGMAFQTFLRTFDLGSFDAYVMLDADYTYDPKELDKVVSPVLSGEADVVMGDRMSYSRIRDAMPYSSYIGNRFLTFAARLLYFRDPRDVCTGYWAFSKDFLKGIAIRAKGFDLEVNIFTEAVKKGFRIRIVPISYKTRLGRKKLKVSDGFVILKRLLIERFF